MTIIKIKGLSPEALDRLQAFADERNLTLDAAAHKLLNSTLRHTDRKQQWEHFSIWLIRTYPPTLRQSCVDDMIADRRREAILDTLRSNHDPEDVFEDAFENICYEADMTPDQVQAMMERLQ